MPNTLGAAQASVDNQNSLMGYEEQQWRERMGQTLARNQQWAMPGPYQTQLSPQDEELFQRWIAQARVPFNPNDDIQDYDMRGFFKALINGDPIARTAINPNDRQMHFPDKWKTPYHQSFSRESMYAKPNAPYWLPGDEGVLVNQQGQVLLDERRNRLGNQ